MAANKHHIGAYLLPTPTGAEPTPAGDEAIAELAGRQHGVVAVEQLIKCGYTRGMIRRRVEASRVLRVHHGVYAVGHRKLSIRGHWMAAVLACGPEAVLSFRSGGALLDLRHTSQTLIDVTVPGTSRHRRAGIRVHRTRALAPEDRTVVDGIPVTSVARTILDLAAVLPGDRLLSVLEQSERIAGFLDAGAIDEAIARCPNRAGVGNLRRLLADYREPPMTRSEMERTFYRLVRGAGLPAPQCNVEVAGLLVDVWWPQWRLVVELDSKPYHFNPRKFETDRIWDATLQRARCRVLRVTGRRLKYEPTPVLNDVLALARLAQREAA